jgi:hypothetical protein
MFIPKNEPERSIKVRSIVDTCIESRPTREKQYANRRRFFLFGSDTGGERVLYNRLFSHIDLVASFLYAADHAEYTIAARRNAEETIVQQMLAAEEDWNDEFRDSGLAYQFGQALLWSVVYDSMFMKVGWNDSREQLFASIVPPHEFGVYDESQPDLDSQHAFVHSYRIDYEDACMRLIKAGLKDKIDDLRANASEEQTTLPVPLSLMITNSQGANLTGQVNPDYNSGTTYDPVEGPPKVEIHEVWIWDDFAQDDDGNMRGDYTCIHMIDPDIILSDSRETIATRTKAGLKRAKKALNEEALRWTDTNCFLTDEHPFIHIRPFDMYNYFWGEAHIERLIPLQRWLNTRLNQIHEILEMQVDPPRVFSGFLGLTDEKADALHGPGTWVTDMQPGAKVEKLVPEMPQDLFAEVTSMGAMFLEASGLTETVTGKGEQGVRGRGHAKQLATTGSARIRKTAVGLEPCLVRLGDVSMKLRARNDDRRIRTDAGMDFYLAQIADAWKMRVAGHSHSPLFADESRELAAALLKSGAIDREIFLRLMHPAGEANMVHALRKREKAEQQFKAMHPELLTKGKKNGAGARA